MLALGLGRGDGAGLWSGEIRDGHRGWELIFYSYSERKWGGDSTAGVGHFTYQHRSGELVEFDRIERIIGAE